MTVGSHNFVKFTVIKPNCQKHSGCVFASGKNAMYPLNVSYSVKPWLNNSDYFKFKAVHKLIVSNY